LLIWITGKDLFSLLKNGSELLFMYCVSIEPAELFWEARAAAPHGLMSAAKLL
jgi:hypothetical protein